MYLTRSKRERAGWQDGLYHEGPDFALYLVHSIGDHSELC